MLVRGVRCKLTKLHSFIHEEDFSSAIQQIQRSEPAPQPLHPMLAVQHTAHGTVSHKEDPVLFSLPFPAMLLHSCRLCESVLGLVSHSLPRMARSCNCKESFQPHHLKNTLINATVTVIECCWAALQPLLHQGRPAYILCCQNLQLPHLERNTALTYLAYARVSQGILQNLPSVHLK